jgi:hypothetical protein
MLNLLSELIPQGGTERSHFKRTPVAFSTSGDEDPMVAVPPSPRGCLISEFHAEQLDSEGSTEAQKSEQANQRQIAPRLR